MTLYKLASTKLISLSTLSILSPITLGRSHIFRLNTLKNHGINFSKGGYLLRFPLLNACRRKFPENSAHLIPHIYKGWSSSFGTNIRTFKETSYILFSLKNLEKTFSGDAKGNRSYLIFLIFKCHQ